jgi:hypothetical protein
MANHVTFVSDFVEIPLWIWASIWGIGVYVVVIISWFALLFTGRYPQGMYDFVARFLRFSGRMYAYSYLMTDTYAPFNGGPSPEYPVRVEVAPALEQYGRWRVFLRAPILLLALISLYLALPFLYLFGIVATAPWVQWIVIVNDGRARGSLQRLTWMYIAFQLRLAAYVLLLAQDFPPFFSEWPRTAAPATGSTTAPAV